MSIEGGEIWLPRLLADAGLVKGTGEARRMIKQNAVSLDGEKITDVEYTIKTMDEVLIKVGKRKFCRVKLTAL
jgi:tyrosyl-tRNA synthetase